MQGDTHPIGPASKPVPVSHRAGDEPIPGYCLIEPLGKGGFGEVWKCQAPGGFFKAIKLIRGSTSATDSSQGWLADQELQALDFIKNIRHPFILTVERAEVRSETLMIVMELADSSMADLQADYQRRSQPGLPHAELLGYLTEAAEALDLMNFQHGLQHLDIKPQNLLLVGSHVKVADFGLVNRLAKETRDGSSSSTQGHGAQGMTPRYAAPETLQGRISRFSDQYSLAIVYQELLTGEVPFKGRNGRQLYLQHLQALPDLAALPTPDRAVVARALEKVPDERFSSCRDFVRALTLCRSPQAAPPVSAAAEAARAGSSHNVRRTDPLIPQQGMASMAGHEYETQVGRTPLGEIWQTQSSLGDTRWAYHLQGFALESAAEQAKALTYLQSVRHKALLRFKVGEVASHRIILMFNPWGQSLVERFRAEKLNDQDLLWTLAEAAHAVDELTALTNLEHLGLSPETLVQGLDGVQLRDFGLISMLWKTGQKPLDVLNPRYGAPELAQGRASHASDQYSLAAIYADMRTLAATGKASPVPTVSGKSRPAGIDLSNVAMPERQVLLKALDIDPNQRFGSCVEMIEALAQAQGGTASHTTTAVQSALATTQESFLATLEAWITQQSPNRADDAFDGPSADGSVRHTCKIEVVPGTVKLRLDVFQQEWHAVPVPAEDGEFRFFLHLPRSFWQRLFAKRVGMDIQVVVQASPSKSATGSPASFVIRPLNCNATQTEHMRDAIAPALLQSLRKCLNASAERRRARRLPFSATIMVRHRVSGSPPTEQPGEVINISRTGIGLVTASPIEQGEIRLLLSLPQGDDPPLPVLVKAAVKRCKPLPNGKYELGAEFLRKSANSD